MPETKSMPKMVGRAIRYRRQELDITQEELCKRMGFPPKRITYISAVENGIYADLKVTRLSLFATALEFSAPNLLLLASNIDSLQAPTQAP